MEWKVEVPKSVKKQVDKLPPAIKEAYQPVEKRCSVKITPNKIKGLAPVFWNKNEFFNGQL